MYLLTLVGTRPNFIKAAPLHRAFSARAGIRSALVHTGQHHDQQMSEVFFAQLNLPKPAYHLGVGNSSVQTVTQQTAEIMCRLEPVLTTERPDWLVVIGDVTSTLAGALVAARLGIRVAHVEAGLRSGDRQMPEEINRILVDSLADALFVTEQSGVDNLQREGIADHKIHFTGNVLIDALTDFLPRATARNTVGRLGLSKGSYVLLTLHRPANVDTKAGLQHLLQLVASTARQCVVVWPLHPRTRANLQTFGLLSQLNSLPNVLLLEPQGYIEFLNLLDQADLVITDSGGIQEETTWLRVPCLTLRSTTERPVTTTLGTNQLFPDFTPETAEPVIASLLNSQPADSQIPPHWDGQTAQRIANILTQ
ncbi:non-hydrolyzing UDP-N-acetylglucosamine 2-epimerase [Spirosoma montaniterrae]|uniref:UDP-N-acetyl glucosamine 2-epimerase n=1 Tax=Spirosoma montaniterrae TaxID=1178516 RepID=A0A1P9WYX2_9BACT|nr:UDP-N-acetylglucosamine 2-epimerase (non-hydrolyzing) [Spirosoma montaniterrae]AQG80575.1 UDP-N-acetyl glucosamine 2-epimerase [Spirosoma montaniterrae]